MSDIVIPLMDSSGHMAFVARISKANLRVPGRLKFRLLVVLPVQKDNDLGASTRTTLSCLVYLRVLRTMVTGNELVESACPHLLFTHHPT